MSDTDLRYPAKGECPDGHLTETLTQPGNRAWTGTCATDGCELPVFAKRIPDAAGVPVAEDQEHDAPVAPEVADLEDEEDELEEAEEAAAGSELVRHEQRALTVVTSRYITPEELEQERRTEQRQASKDDERQALQAEQLEAEQRRAAAAERRAAAAAERARQAEERLAQERSRQIVTPAPEQEEPRARRRWRFAFSTPLNADWHR